LACGAVGGYARKNAIVAGGPGEGEERAGADRAEMAEGQRGRILKATAELVGENGYLDFKVVELLGRAHVSLSIVRRRFGDKRGCYLALLDHGAKKRSGGAPRPLRGAKAPGRRKQQQQ